MKKIAKILSVCFIIALLAMTATACGSDNAKSEDKTEATAIAEKATEKVTEKATEKASEKATEKAADSATTKASETSAEKASESASGAVSDEDMEKAVHNSFSDSFCKSINESDIMSMEMSAEGNYVVWKMTFKKDLTEDKIESYKDKLIANDLTSNLDTIRNAVKSDVESTDFGMIVRYYTKDGELILEQKAE